MNLIAIKAKYMSMNNNHRKNIIVFFLVCLCCDAIFAKLRTEQEIMSIAEKVVSTGTLSSSFKKCIISYVDLRIAAHSDSYYVINTGNVGFVIVSTDDELPELLGYCESGNYNEKKMPPALQMWLNNYDIEYQAWRNSGSNPFNVKVGQQSRNALKSIDPLLSTKWGQSFPFNNYCPRDCRDSLCPTGCTTTAIAQIMKFWQWPKQGVGSASLEYVCKEDSTYKKSLFVDMDSIPYQWNNMVDYYGLGTLLSKGITTSEQQEAVARLMYHIAIAEQVHFTSDGTGLNFAEIRNKAFPALFSHFCYSDDIHVFVKDYCQSDSLEIILYDELMSRRPIFVLGTDISKGGHAFVCDGYDNAFFHFNWGWYGLGDGWFRLSALNPSVLTSSFSLNSFVQFFTGIRPSTYSNPIKHEGQILLADSIAIVPYMDYEDSYLADIFNITVAGIREYIDEFSVALYSNDSDNIVQLLFPENMPFPVNIPNFFYGYKNANMKMEIQLKHALPGGDYRIAAVYKNKKGEWTPVSLPNGRKYITFRKQWGVVIGGPVSVYTISGQFVTSIREWKGLDEIKHLNLPKGVYLIKQGNNVLKFSNYE